jgi:hypothetical protein
LDQYHTGAVKISFVLFDEIEKASDTLWNLLLGILDKGTLTLGDNRKVDFSQTMIFMTSNLGPMEMSELSRPRLGFMASQSATQHASAAADRELDGKIARSGVEAARRNFAPEFMNRLDKIVAFKTLGPSQLRRILEIELKMVQQRIFNATPENSFVFEVTDPAKDLLLNEGTDMKYGARHSPADLQFDRHQSGASGRLYQSRLGARGGSFHIHQGSDNPVPAIAESLLHNPVDAAAGRAVHIFRANSQKTRSLRSGVRGNPRLEPTSNVP